MHPDPWERFERAMAVVAKSPPQHRTKATKDIPKKRAKGQAQGKRSEVKDSNNR